MTLDECADRIRNVAAPIRDKWRALRPEWTTTDSPLKYVDWALEDTISKSADLARVLAPRPDDMVCELGPGACYLAYMLQEWGYGCNVVGFDQADRPLYAETAAALGVDVHDWTIEARVATSPIERVFNPSIIVATQISWMNEWTPDEGRAFVRMLLRDTLQDGRVILFPNPGAFNQADPGDVFAPLRSVALTMTQLGHGFVFTEGHST